MEEAGKVYCRDDYIQKFAEKCCYCKHAIDGVYLLCDDRKYHQNCFKVKENEVREHP